LVLAAALLLAGCGGVSSDDEAVRQGVIDYVSGKAGVDFDLMDMDVTSISYDGDTAVAVVSFQAKGSNDPAAGMQMQYTLERKGRRWVVEGKAGMGGSAHGDMTNPHGTMPPPAGGEMPSGHPPVEGAPPDVKN
jgi:hypothetical protein